VLSKKCMCWCFIYYWGKCNLCEISHILCH